MKLNKKGFTLVEMLIVIVIIGILAAALIPRLSTAKGKANDVGRKGDLQQMVTALVSYGTENYTFPAGSEQVIMGSASSNAMISGGINSVPVSKDTVSFTGLNGATTASGYMYYGLSKNGAANSAFAIMSRAETEGAANFVMCNTTAISEANNVYLCSSVKKTGSCSAASATSSACTVKDLSEAAILYKY